MLDISIHDVTTEEGWTKEFRGMWNDDFRSTDKIIDDIRKSRTFTRTVETW